MKKFLWIAALLAALALVFVGCGESDPDPEEEEYIETRGVAVTGDETWWVAPGAKGNGKSRKYLDNKVPVVGEDDDASYVHVYFQPHGVTLPNPDTFEITLKLRYESPYGSGLSFMWQCAFDPYGTWARSSADEDYMDFVTPDIVYTFTCQPNIIFRGGNWDEDKLSNGKTRLTYQEMHGLCIQIPIEYGFEAGFVEILEFSYRNMAPTGPQFTGPNPPSN